MSKPMGLVRQMEATVAFESQAICYLPQASPSPEDLTLNAFTWCNLSRFLFLATSRKERKEW